MSVNHNENLWYLHQAHSFVRGNWGNTARAAPMILAKCCHDLDYLLWLLGETCVSLSSVGSTQVYRRDRPPVGTTVPILTGVEPPERCTDGCPITEECPYYAPRIYLRDDTESFMIRAISAGLSYEARLHALKTGPYGRCVYRCDNDVVDHQVVTMNFPSGATATLTMQGFSHVEGRTTRIDGTRATLLANEARREIIVQDHHAGPDITQGHGDVYIVV